MTNMRNGGKTLAAAIVLLSFAATSSSSALIPGISKQGLKVGSQAPDFTFRDIDGKLVSLSQFRGKKVFIFSWSSWCRCKYQLPALEIFHQDNKGRNLEVIAVAADSQGWKWAKPYLDKANATFIKLLDPNNELGRKYNMIATENGFLIDETGAVAMSQIGFYFDDAEQMEELNRLLAMSVEAPDAAVPPTLEQRFAELAAKLAEGKADSAAMLDLAEIYRLTGKTAEAEKLLREAIKKSPTSSDSHYRLGVLLFESGKEEDGVKEWKKARHLEPTNYIFMRNIQAYEDPARFYADVLGVTCHSKKKKKCKTCGPR